jgi:hypothetical protein
MTVEQLLNLIATIFGALGSIYVLKSICKSNTTNNRTNVCNETGIQFRYY